MTPSVSIITPVYNGADFLPQCLDSVRAQTFGEYEHIVVDDGSTDRSAGIVEEYARRDGRIRFLRNEKNSGPRIARNLAAEMARGRHIAFLDSDDWWLPQKLEKQLRFMREKDAAVSFTSWERRTIDGGRVLRVVRAPPRIDYSYLLRDNVMSSDTVMYDREKTAGVVYNPHAVGSDDYILWLALLKRVEFAYGLDEILSVYRARAKSLSSSVAVSVRWRWETYRRVEGLAWHRSVFYFCSYALIAVFRRVAARFRRYPCTE